MIYGVLVIIGFFAGLLSGLFGLGGGLVVVPALVFCLPLFGFDQEVVVHCAIATTFTIMFFNSGNAALMHYRKHGFKISLVLSLAPFLLLGTLIGSLISYYVSGRLLLIFFILYLMTVITRFLLNMSKKDKAQNQAIVTLTNAKKSIYGILTGIISAFTGGGSSLIIVPILKQHNYSFANATGVANALNILIALFATSSYIWLGEQNSHAYPIYTTGFVYWPAFLFIIIGSLSGVPCGQYLIHTLPEKLAEKLFLSVMLFILVLMIYKVSLFI